MSRQIHILWTDDEIDLLKPYILFLEEREYRVTTAANGADALSLVEEHDFDLIFLDENMPGLSGLETLDRIKTITPSTPVVMITKSEEEDIMDEALPHAHFYFPPLTNLSSARSECRLIRLLPLVTGPTSTRGLFSGKGNLMPVAPGGWKRC